MFHTFSHCHQDLLQRSEALQMLVDVQMEAEGWGRDQRAGALAGLTVTSAQSLMQARGGGAHGGGGAGSSGRVRKGVSDSPHEENLPGPPD